MERDKFMSPLEAKAFGLIDTVLEHPPKYNEGSLGDATAVGNATTANQQRTISV